MRYPMVISEADTVTNMVHGRSIARYGDGELRLCLGQDSVSQKWSPEIERELREILVSPPDNLLPCIPNLDDPERETPRAYFWEMYKRPVYTNLYSPGVLYGSSFVTRPDNAPWIDNDAYWEVIESLWAPDKTVLLVAGCPDKFRPFMPPFEGANVTYIEGLPERNAYSQLDAITEACTFSRVDTVLISLGAAGTCLAARLAKRGIHAVDVGHIHMFMHPENRGAFSYGIDDLATPAYRAELKATHDAKPWGDTGYKFVDDIVPFLETVGARFVVDYGAGRGTLGDMLRKAGYRVEEFEPSREPFVPPKIADVVLSTDVFEHVEPEKLDNVLRYTYLIARKAGFFAIAKQPAKRILAHTGRNAHLICKPTEFWVAKLKEAGWSRVEVIRDKWKKVTLVCYKGETK